MYRNALIVILSGLVFILAYCVYLNKQVVKAEKLLNDSLIAERNKVYEERENSIKMDSIRYELVIDSLNDKIKEIQKQRKYVYITLESKLTKINTITADSSFIAINDSIEKFLTMRHE